MNLGHVGLHVLVAMQGAAVDGAQGVVGSGTPDLVPSVWRMLGALVVVLGLLGALAWALRRSAALRRTKGGFGVESTLALGDRRSLLIVTIEGRRLLLGASPGGVSLVTELKAPAMPTFEQAVARATTEGPRA